MGVKRDKDGVSVGGDAALLALASTPPTRDASGDKVVHHGDLAG